MPNEAKSLGSALPEINLLGHKQIFDREVYELFFLSSLANFFSLAVFWGFFFSAFLISADLAIRSPFP
jgi:uncharacterized metal-binding protein